MFITKPLNPSCIFLLGAGISIPAKMPSTAEITNRILSGENIERHTDGSYLVRNRNDNSKCEYVEKIVAFLEIVKRELILYNRTYKGRRSAEDIDYEQLYYLCNQIKGDYDTPEAYRLIKSLNNKILPFDPVCQLMKIRVSKTENLRRTVSETLTYIEWIVSRLLSSNSSNLDYLKCIGDACEDHSLEFIRLYSLNHDLLLEKYLKKRGRPCNLGFEEITDVLSKWNPAQLGVRDKRVFLGKLHGSVNWWRLRPEDENDWRNELIVRITNRWSDPININGRIYRSIGGPKILVGTTNKILEYTHDIYIDLFFNFYRSLRCTRKVVICGYSFSDRAINSRLIDWYYSATDHKIIIIHPEVSELKANANGAIRNKWKDWESKGCISVISKEIQNTSWDEIKEKF